MKKHENVSPGEMWLKLLDGIEEVRQKCSENPKEYSQQSILDECESIVNGASLDVEEIKSTLSEYRQRVEEKPLAYPKDYLVRLISAKVAEAAGYESRKDWTQQLREKDDSCYAKRYYGVCGEFHY